MGWDQIKADVEKNGNVLTVQMENLRDAHGAGKLGRHVREEITSALLGIGLATIPQELPSYQHELVRLYKRGTPVGDLIEKVLNPSESTDQTIVERLGGGKAPDFAAIVEKIKKLVAD
jgi:hypothetical protein